MARGMAVASPSRQAYKKRGRLLQDNYHVKILVGIEAEILPTGEVYLESDEGLDIVLASYHGSPSEEVYYRAVLKAVTDPKVDVLAHHAWTAGGFGPVEKYDDMLIELMARHEVAIEINSKHVLPSWDFLQKCKEKGVKYTIGSDAHKAADVGSVAWAKNTARHIDTAMTGLFMTVSIDAIRNIFPWRINRPSLAAACLHQL